MKNDTAGSPGVMSEDTLHRRMTKKSICVKPMETDAEILGRARVHYQAWQEAYTGLIRQSYLDRRTPEESEKRAFAHPENTFVALDGERVVGFVVYGADREGASDTGEIYALYVLREYYGTGVGARLMDAALTALPPCQTVRLWVLKDNARARRFYEKCGFRADGAEMYSEALDAAEIRMTRPAGKRMTAADIISGRRGG